MQTALSVYPQREPILRKHVCQNRFDPHHVEGEIGKGVSGIIRHTFVARWKRVSDPL
jgi:hypothetical protein